MILPLIPYHDPRLRQPVKWVDDTSTVTELAENLRQTLAAAPTALGLAAPQVGEMVAMFVLKINEKHVSVIINPELMWTDPEFTATMQEGCLSYPGTSVSVIRPQRIKVMYLDELGVSHDEELDGMLARVFLHELDHLMGVTILDKVGQDDQEKILAAQARRARREQDRCPSTRVVLR